MRSWDATSKVIVGECDARKKRCVGSVEYIVAVTRKNSPNLALFAQRETHWGNEERDNRKNRQKQGNCRSRVSNYLQTTR